MPAAVLLTQHSEPMAFSKANHTIIRRPWATRLTSYALRLPASPDLPERTVEDRSIRRHTAVLLLCCSLMANGERRPAIFVRTA